MVTLFERRGEETLSRQMWDVPCCLLSQKNGPCFISRYVAFLSIMREIAYTVLYHSWAVPTSLSLCRCSLCPGVDGSCNVWEASISDLRKEFAPRVFKLEKTQVPYMSRRMYSLSANQQRQNFPLFLHCSGDIAIYTLENNGKVTEHWKITLPEHYLPSAAQKLEILCLKWYWTVFCPESFPCLNLPNNSVFCSLLSCPRCVCVKSVENYH